MAEGVDRQASESRPSGSDQSVSSPLPEYEAPPLVEVVCGVQFAPLSNLRVPHFGLFWDEVRNEFPSCQHADPLGDFESQARAAGSQFPIPRVWLISGEGDQVLQLQNDRFLHNWRRSNDDDEYPRFAAVFDAFKGYLHRFTEFVDANDLGDIAPQECELTYINHVLEGEGWEEISQIGTIMRDLTWTPDKRFLPAPDRLGWQANFELPDGQGNMNVSMRLAERRSDQRRLFVLQLTATGPPANTSVDSVQEWFSTAHEWIVRGFHDLTVLDTQEQQWKLKS